MIGCLYDERKINTSRKKFLDKLTINRQNILKNDEKSDIKGINMKSGKLISAGYNMPLYEVPRYNSFKPDGGCPNAEEFVTKSLWMDIHKFRTKDEIDIEIEIINSTIKEFQ